SRWSARAAAPGRGWTADGAEEGLSAAHRRRRTGGGAEVGGRRPAQPQRADRVRAARRAAQGGAVAERRPGAGAGWRRPMTLSWAKIRKAWAMAGSAALVIFVAWAMLAFRANATAREAVRGGDGVSVRIAAGAWTFEPADPAA